MSREFDPSGAGQGDPNAPAKSDGATWSFEDARRIRTGERDHELRLHTEHWPNDGPCPEGWHSANGHLYRYIENQPGEKGWPEDDRRGALAVSLKESLLRFPAAPIRGVQRLHEYHTTPPTPPPHLYTYRVLTSSPAPQKIGRIFLFHNGLNELDRMGLYYQLASDIIAAHQADPKADEEGGVACILRPFPGHLTRAPFAAFSEEPLHRYLWDGSYLFSQFLRYMLETQWFLSAIVRRSRYRSPSGAELLLEAETPDGSRLQTGELAGAISKTWHALYVASEKGVDNAVVSQPEVQSLKEKPPEEVFSESIESLRDVLKLDLWGMLGAGPPRTDTVEEPSLHVVGYSLGGFAAQSVFMSWPFVISSCTTLLSGGALRELSPTAFAHPEEWQTVLHSLSYELDEGMLDNRFEAGPDEVAGLDRELFHYFQRTFYEVFQQEYRGSYETRVEAFRQRMLFVVGGNDPIVRPKSVLDSAPKGGMNLLEIGALGHFLGNDPHDSEETQQRRFWLPEIGGLIGRFSSEAAELHLADWASTWLDANLEVQPMALAGPDHDGQVGETTTQSADRTVRRMSDREWLKLSGDGHMTAPQFGACLDDMLARQCPEPGACGYLFVLRNEIPTLLLPPAAVQRRARALYHDDRHIVEFCREVEGRSAAFMEAERTTLVLPWNAMNLLLYLDPPHRFPSQAETAVGHILGEISMDEAWRKSIEAIEALQRESEASVRVFDGRTPLTARNEMGESAAELIRLKQEEWESPLYVSALPDCWLWVSPSFLGFNGSANPSMRKQQDALIAAAQKYVESPAGLAKELREDNVRMITVSRARYNPRFRGSLILSPNGCKELLVHIALCLAASYEYRNFDLERQRVRPRGGEGA
jgi:hypothetical protein